MSETRKVMGQLNSFLSSQVKKLSTSVTGALRGDTPKLTGNAQNNWVPTIGAPFPRVDGSQAAPSDTAQQQGLARVQSNYKYPAIVYITNNVEYLKDLNDGSSRKAPAGFVQTAVARGIKAAL